MDDRDRLRVLRNGVDASGATKVSSFSIINGRRHEASLVFKFVAWDCRPCWSSPRRGLLTRAAGVSESLTQAGLGSYPLPLEHIP
jgi:hypothetical protein